MDQQVEQVKAFLKAEIEKTEQELKQKKAAYKVATKKPSTPFMETKLGRGINHFLAFISTPCAITHRNARMKLDHPRAFRAEEAIDRAEKVVERLEKVTLEVGDKTNRMAMSAAMLDVILGQYSDLEVYHEKIESLRERLRAQAQRLRKPGNGPTKNETNAVAEMLEELKKRTGGGEPNPQGA